MLPKAYRLPASQFTPVKTQGQLVRTGLFNLLMSDSNQPVSRFGFIVSTKISKKATLRNRLRRILGEGLRPLLPSLAPGRDYIILAKHSLKNATLDDITKVFHEILAPGSD